jgi:hypothetical protein
MWNAQSHQIWQKSRPVAFNLASDIQLAREQMHRLDDARSLIRQLFRIEVDLIPEQQNKTLTVRLHPLTAEVHDRVVRYLCNELTSTETVFPGTDLRLIYEIASSS